MIIEMSSKEDNNFRSSEHHHHYFNNQKVGQSIYLLQMLNNFHFPFKLNNKKNDNANSY